MPNCDSVMEGVYAMRQRLKALQYRYALADGSKRGGIHVQGKVAKLNSLQLFGDPPHVDALGENVI